MIRHITLISVLLFTTAYPEQVYACSFEDTNGDSLILSTGQATISGPSLLTLDGITFGDVIYNSISLNLDIANLRWTVDPPYPPAGLLDLTTASVILIGDNDIRFEKISYAGNLYNATIVVNPDGTLSGKDVSEWQEGSVDVSPFTDFGSWTGSGGTDETSEDNPRFTLNICDTQSIRIELDSEVDNYLFLLDEEGNIVAENDDRLDEFDNLNAAIDVTLERGTYTIVVATWNPGETDIFDISVGPDPDDPNPNPSFLGGALNLFAIPGTAFVSYASVGGRVSDAGTGEPIVAAEVEVNSFVAGFPSTTVFSNNSGDYFLRVFANRLQAGNTFWANAAVEGCTPSENQSALVNPATNHAIINFNLAGCIQQDDPNNGNNAGNGDDEPEDSAISIEAASCTAVRFSFGSIQFNEINVSGTASGPVGAFVTGTNSLQCTAWTNCERQDGEPATTNWTDYSTTTILSPQNWNVTLQGTISSANATATFACPTV